METSDLKPKEAKPVKNQAKSKPKITRKKDNIQSFKITHTPIIIYFD